VLRKLAVDGIEELLKAAAQKADFHSFQDKERFEFNRFITLASQTVEVPKALQRVTSN
jgi:hypothetical protein